MQLTTKGRFATSALIDLGLRQFRGPVTLASISQRQQISLSYLEQLFSKLRRHGLLESTRGPGGGYRLAKPMESVSVADIVFAVDEPRTLTQATAEATCNDDPLCTTRELWADLNRCMIDFMDSVSLHDLVLQQRCGVSKTQATPQVTAES